MVVMSIAGVDPSAGAGIYADLKTFQAHGVYGCGVVTALTAQNPYKVFSLSPVDKNYVSEQIDAVLDAYDIKYVKTGMLYSPEIIKLVSKKIHPKISNPLNNQQNHIIPIFHIKIKFKNLD